MSSLMEAVMGGIISAWNISVVASLASSFMASVMSSTETAGNSSTCMLRLALCSFSQLGIFRTVLKSQMSAVFGAMVGKMKLV